MTKEQFEQRFHLMRDTARANVDKMLTEHNLDVILAPADARMASIASIAGYSHGVVPLGFANFNGRPFGMNVLARAGEEAKILAFMSATFPDTRKPPPLLANWDNNSIDDGHI
jgi:amidase